jgi:hypothetical protein
MAYQDPDYALLYLKRVGRYAGPGKGPCAYLDALASRMEMRMRYADPPGVAQATLVDGGEDAAPASRRASFCLCDLAGMLPPSAADPVLDVMSYLRLSRGGVVLKFSSRAGWRRRWTEMWALLRYARKYSRRANIENAWVERWLHMIDRVGAVQPETVAEMVRSADVVRGSGADYHRDLANWHLIVDHLVKPVCDGTVTPLDLAAALRTVLQEAADRPEPAVLEGQIARLLAA